MTPKETVLEFFSWVRSGRDLERVHNLMAPQVLAHQVVSEALQTVTRSPQNYLEHVLEMRATYGEFTLEIEEVLTDGDRVYVRWKQEGRHLETLEGFPPTNKPLLERASAVYRVQEGRIVEYWIQIDRAGLRAQLERNAE